jgi:hypothetical protein
MLPASLAFGWLFWRQHRVSLTLAAGYLLLAAVVSAVLPAYSTPDFARGMIALLATITLTTVPILMLVIFTYSLEGGDLNLRESCFPQRLFRLPVPTRSLVIWPIVYGAVLSLVVWLVVGCLVIQPWTRMLNHDMPRWWPALFMAAALAWIQALLWSPIALPGLRVLLLLALIPLLVASAVVGVEQRLSEGALVALFAGLAAVGWTLAFVGVHKARRGDVADWEALLVPLRRFGAWLSQRWSRFSSASRAQQWYEWRMNGGTLPFMTALLLPMLLVPLVFPQNDVIPITTTLLGLLATPVLIASMSGWPGHGRARWVKDPFALSPFLATLPTTTADLVAAKLRMAAWGSLFSWGLIAVVAPAAIVASGHANEVVELVERATQRYGSAQVIVGSLACALLLFVATWRRKIDGLFVTMTGSQWIVTPLAIFSVFGTFALVGFGAWIYQHPATHATAWTVIPWLLAAIAVVRAALAAWALRALLHRGLLLRTTAVRWLAAWLLLATALFAPLAWATPCELLPTGCVALVVLYALPMARLAAMPLALASNRHR